MSQATLSDLERGLRPTPVDELFALALALQISVMKLLDPAGLEGVSTHDVDVGDIEDTLNFEDGRRLIVLAEDPWSLGVDIGVGWRDHRPTKIYRGEDLLKARAADNVERLKKRTDPLMEKLKEETSP